MRLEVDDDVCEFEVALLLEMRQHACAEEDLALPDAVEVRVQLQRLDLKTKVQRVHLACVQEVFGSHIPGHSFGFLWFRRSACATPELTKFSSI